MPVPHSTGFFRLLSAESRNPLFAEPSYMVVYDIAFKRDTYFDGAFGVMTKVIYCTSQTVASLVFRQTGRTSSDWVFKKWLLRVAIHH